jgi:DNA replication and repair protein RecF
MNRKPLREYGSLGQKKSVMIAMKLAALEVISTHLRDRAILVLDEAFAEFDSGRTGSLLNLLSVGGQVFLAKIRIFRVADGRVTES